MKTSKLIINILIVGLGMLSTTACETEKVYVQPAKEVKGPSETGGGNLSRLTMDGLETSVAKKIKDSYNFIEDIIEAYIETAQYYLKQSPEHSIDFFDSYKDVSPEHYKVLNYKLAKRVAVKLDYGKKLLKVAKTLDQPLVLTDKACIDLSNEEKEGSSIYLNKLCLSARNLSKTTRFSDLNVSIRALIMHELGHKAGLNQEEAKHLEALFWYIGKKEYHNIELYALSYEIDNFAYFMKTELNDHHLLVQKNNADIELLKNSIKQSKFLSLIEHTKKFGKLDLNFEQLVSQWKSFLNEYLSIYLNDENLQIETLSKYSVLRYLGIRPVEKVPEAYRLLLDKLDLQIAISSYKIQENQKQLTITNNRFISNLNHQSELYNKIEQSFNTNYSINNEMHAKLIAINNAVTIISQIYAGAAYITNSNLTKRFLNNKNASDMCEYLRLLVNDDNVRHLSKCKNNKKWLVNFSRLSDYKITKPLLDNLFSDLKLENAFIKRKIFLNEVYACENSEDCRNDGSSEEAYQYAQKFFKKQNPSLIKALYSDLKTEL